MARKTSRLARKRVGADKNLAALAIKTATAPTRLAGRRVRADKNLAAVIGAKEGQLVSQVQMLKGLRRYINRQRLREGAEKLQVEIMRPEQKFSAVRLCPFCSASIATSYQFCDQCGTKL